MSERSYAAEGVSNAPLDHWGGSLLALSVIFVALTLAGIGPLAAPALVMTQLTPVVVAVDDASADPRTITVEFPWAAIGYCAGQFSVSVIETDRQVRIGPVLSTDPRVHEQCDGIGSDGTFATITVRLKEPLGTRAAVRASDGHSIPVVSPADLER